MSIEYTASMSMRGEWRLPRASFIAALAWAGATFAASDRPTDDWTQGSRLTPQAARVMDILRNADAYGLQPSDYPLPIAGADPGARSQFDKALSQTVARFISDLHYGRIGPRSAGFHLPAARQDLNLPAALRRVMSSTDVDSTLATFEPAPAPYARLKAALTRYRSLAQQPSLTHLPPLPRRSLQQGDEYAGAPALRRLLTAVGDLRSADAGADPSRSTIDAPLADAVRKFQQRHGLDVDGVIGPATFAELSTPLDARVRQIALAMERWRWLAALDRPNIAVNIPQSTLLVLPERADKGVAPLEMRVIVGQTYPHTRTPIFASSITQVVFQPYWDVPSGILERELLQPIRRNPAYLAKHDLEIVEGQGDDARVVDPTPAAVDALAGGALRLRQRPGPTNALGPIKFVMRNPFNVYLHATPQRELFERSRRTFSHGCIRVSEPAALAAYVLQHAPGDWSAAAIAAALQGSETLRVTLTEPVHVVVFYSTSVVTASGTVLFFEDVYGHDRELQKMLDAALMPVREQRVPAA
ncbi:MAG TPA: L,D-transpeptidase family protein [Steroidobacteraceae bacterium]|nr:L,D-transpeptidase family protein [Steroidobacteraceae bacterium]